MRRRIRLWPLALIVAALGIATSAHTAANTVPASKMTDDSRSITPNDLKPTDCAGLALTAKLSGSGTITGTAAAELITGGAAADSISGNDGDDCIMGGAGGDTIDGGNGTDVCIGGPGIDLILSCETSIQ